MNFSFIIHRMTLIFEPLLSILRYPSLFRKINTIHFFDLAGIRTSVTELRGRVATL